MLPNEKGSYRGFPQKWSVGKSKNGAVEFAVELVLNEQWNGEGWNECDYGITGYFYLVTKEGKINETTVKSVEDAFDWDRRTGTTTLANAHELPPCQVFCDFDEYNGKQTMKVKWLNPFENVPSSGVGQSDPQEVQSIDTQYGALFRATATKTPAAKQAVAPSPSSNPKAAADVEQVKAKQAFAAAFPELPKPAMANEWKQAVHSYLPGKPAELWAVADWKRFVADNFTKKIDSPLSEEPQFAESELPF